jgi:arylsulfatase A
VVKELEALLNRYRDGGYSRELPPAGVKPKAAFEPLPSLKNAEPVDLTTYQGADWTQRDRAWFVKAGDKGSPFTGPLKLQNGVLEFQLRLGEANRHSLRIHTADQAHSFRVVLSRAFVEIAKNPSKGENVDQTLPLGKTRVKFKTSEWLTVRLTFQNDELTVECAGTMTKAKHAIFAAEKLQANFIAFEGEVGVRGVQVAK